MIITFHYLREHHFWSVNVLHSITMDWLQLDILAVPSNAASLMGQPSMSSLASPSPEPTQTPSIFARTLGRTQLIPAHSSLSLRSAEELQASSLSSQEEDQAQQLGFGEGKLTHHGRQTLLAHVLHQEMQGAKVITPTCPLLKLVHKQVWPMGVLSLWRKRMQYYFALF